MDGFEALQNRISDFLQINNRYVVTNVTDNNVPSGFPGYYQGGYHAFHRYYNSLSHGVSLPYTINPFIHIIELPPGKNLIELKDYELIPTDLQKEYIRLTNRYNDLLRYLQVDYIEPNNGETQQYYATVQKRGGRELDYRYVGNFSLYKSSPIYKKVQSQIRRLLHLRVLMRAEYQRLRQRLDEIENSERIVPIVEDIAYVIDIKDSDIYNFAMFYIFSKNAYNRSFSYINVKHLEIQDKYVGKESLNSDTIDLNKCYEVESEICKGPDILQHNLLTSGFRNTLSDLYFNMKELLFNINKGLGNADDNWKQWVATVEAYFDLPLLDESYDDYLILRRKRNDLCIDLYNLFDGIGVNVLRDDLNNYTAMCRRLTNILLQLGVYGKTSEKNITSCLGLFVARRHELSSFTGKDNWYVELTDVINYYKEEGLKYVFRCKPTIVIHQDNNGRVYQSKQVALGEFIPVTEYNEKIVVMEDIPSKVDISPELVIDRNKTIDKNKINTALVAVKKDGKEKYKRYFGDFYYKIDTSMYEELGWVDNSNSGNLCSITSLIMNPRFRCVLEKKKIDIANLIAMCILRSNTYSDSRLFKVDWNKMKDIHKYISRVTGYKFNVTYHKIKKNKNDKNPFYKSNLYTLSDFDDIRLDNKDRYDIVLANGHAFTVCNDDHLDHIKNTLKSELEPEDRPKYNIIDSIRFDTIVLGYLKDKSKLHDLIGDELGCSETIPQTYIHGVDDLGKWLNTISDKIDDMRKGSVNIEKFKEKFRKACPLNLLVRLIDECKNNADIDRVLFRLRRLEEKMYEMSNSIYSVMDMETYCDDNRKAICYGISYNVFDDEKIISEYNIHNINNDISSDDLIYNYLKDNIRIMDEHNVNRIKVFAHNGGKFDTVLLKKACSKINHEMLGVGYKVNCYIEGGGRIKLYSITLSKNETYTNAKGEECTKNVNYNIDIVDSWILLESKISDIGRDYGIPNCKKGAYPYLLYRHAIVELNKEKMDWTRKELRDLCTKYMESGKIAESDDIRVFLNESPNKQEFNLIDLFEEYCDQDVRIAAEGLIKANMLYSEIDLSAVGKLPYNILQNRGRGFILNSNFKLIRPRLLDCVTLSSLAKIIARFYVISESDFTYKGIDHEYLRAYTGGLTYISDVMRIESSIMTLIVKNPYFYIDNKPCNRKLIKYFVAKYEYDIKKPKLTYNRKNPPPEVIALKKAMEDNKKACILLLDANSLYPSAICKMDEFGGFPVGKMNKFTGPPPEGKLWIGYAKINWTDEALEHDYRAFPMHPLIISTKFGNRHLKPTDKECEYMGMSSIMYKSAINTASNLYSIDVINGVYWDKCSKNFGKLCDVMYQARLTQSAAGNKCLEMCIKKLLNSFYGILLEKCHHESVSFLNRNKSIIETSDCDPKGNIVTNIEVVPSEKDIHMEKYGGLSTYCDMGNFSIATKIELKKLDNYASSVHYGVFVLDMSKYIMNELFYALNWDILYTDTDSAFIFNEQFDKVKKEKPDLMGTKLGQFKPDFDGKFKKILSDNNIIDGDMKGMCCPLVERYGIVSILSIFNNKKGYCNVLFGQVGPEEDTYLTVCIQTAYKGLPHSNISIQKYEQVNTGEDIIIDTNKKQAIFRRDIKTGEIYIFDKDTKQFNKNVRNDNKIPRE